MNIKSLLLAAGVLAINSTGAASLPDKFVRAIHQVESSGRVGKVVGDYGKANGAFQIHYSYFKDAAEYDKSLGSDYSMVNNVEFAKRVMTAYLNRYALNAIKQKDLATLARIHNGGPNGHKNPKTIKYWMKVQKHLQ